MGMLAFAGAALLGAAAPAATPPRDPADEEVIIVTGERVTRRAIQQFVDQLTYQPRQLQFMTWAQHVCPSVHGLRAAQAEKIEARMRQVAEAAGMRVGPAGCVGNVMLIVAPDKPLFLRTLLRKNSFYFDGLPFWKVNEILRDRNLAVAWHLQGLPVAPGGREREGLAATSEQASRIRPSAKPTFDAAVVVVDASAIDGLTVTQLADYASMRAYAKFRPDKLQVQQASTVLSVIDAPPNALVPAGLTHWDLGMLRGLYGGASHLLAAAKRSEMRKSLEQSLMKPR